MFNILILILLIVLRVSFTTSVCFCDFEEDYFNLRNLENDEGYNKIKSENYYCHKDLKHYM